MSQFTYSQNTQLNFSQFTYPQNTQLNFLQLSFSQSQQYISIYDFPELNRDLASLKIQNCYRKWKKYKKIKLFCKKMQARKKFGMANRIKRFILFKTTHLKFTSALKLILFSEIKQKLKKKKSFYF
jgi:hypothetical protein